MFLTFVVSIMCILVYIIIYNILSTILRGFRHKPLSFATQKALKIITRRDVIEKKS